MDDYLEAILTRNRALNELSPKTMFLSVDARMKITELRCADEKGGKTNRESNPVTSQRVSSHIGDDCRIGTSRKCTKRDPSNNGFGSSALVIEQMLVSRSVRIPSIGLPVQQE